MAEFIFAPNVRELKAYNYQLVDSLEDIELNKGVVAEAKHLFDIADSGSLMHPSDEPMARFLDWIKLSVMAGYGVQVDGLWLGGQGAGTNVGGNYAVGYSWQHSFSYWLKRWYPEVFNGYVDSWHKFSSDYMGKLAGGYIAVINYGYAIIGELTKRILGVEIRVPDMDNPFVDPPAEPGKKVFGDWVLWVGGGVLILLGGLIAFAKKGKKIFL